jgi:hypothetical protein
MITFLAWEPRCHVSSRKCDWLITYESEAPRPSDVISEKVYLSKVKLQHLQHNYKSYFHIITLQGV